MIQWTVFLDVLLSVVAIVATGYHAVLVMRQKLSYFHSVRYLLFSSYILFGVVVASEFVLARVSDIATASLMLKTSISTVIIAAILLNIAVTVLMLQLRGHESPYREILRRRPFSLLATSAINVVVFVLVWSAFDFEFKVGEKALLGILTLIPYHSIFQLAALSLVFIGFILHQSKLLSKEILVSQPESLFRVIRETSLLWMAIGTILFTVNGALRSFGIDIVEFGDLLASMVLGYLAYIYVRPTALLEFFTSDSPLATELTRKRFLKVFDFDPGFGKKILLEVDSVSDYIDLAYYFLGSGWKPGICVTYEGSPLFSGSRNSAIKIIELSTSAERITVSKGEIIEAPLFRKNTYDLLKWSIECNPDGRLVLDGLTHLIHLLGIDEVYSIVSYVSEVCAKNGVQLLLILNYQAHKLEVLSSFEGIADHVIQLEKNRSKQIKPFTHLTATTPGRRPKLK